MKTEKLDYFFSQPHQPFFVFGVISAIVFMIMFMFGYRGLLHLEINAIDFHAYSLIFIIFTSFFQGFLLTTFPRFSQTMALEKQIYITNFTLMFLGAMLLLVGSLFSMIMVYLGMILVLGAQLYTMAVFYQIYKASPMPDLFDQFWLMIGFGAGIVSNLLFIIALATDNIMLGAFAKTAGVYLYLVIVALTVGQRMIPFFSHVMINKNKNVLKIVFVLSALYTITSTLSLKIDFLFTLAAGVYLGYEIYKWKLPYQNAEAILWILHLALFWLPLGLVLGSVGLMAEYIFDKPMQYMMLHLIMLGFLTMVLIGFGTRVTLGHSGNMMQIDGVTKALFYLTQVVVLTRALYSLSGGVTILFDISMTLWLLLFVIWSVKYLPLLLYGKKL